MISVITSLAVILNVEIFEEYTNIQNNVNLTDDLREERKSAEKEVRLTDNDVEDEDTGFFTATRVIRGYIHHSSYFFSIYKNGYVKNISSSSFSIIFSASIKKYTSLLGYRDYEPRQNYT